MIGNKKVVGEFIQKVDENEVVPNTAFEFAINDKATDNLKITIERYHLDSEAGRKDFHDYWFS